jgi:Fe-S cluster assembly protein SufD
MVDKMVTATDPAIVSGVFTRQAVSDLSRRLGEPDWMREKRQVAWSLFEDMPMPATHDERWRRTDLRAFKWGDFRLPEVCPEACRAQPADLAEALQAAGEAVTNLDETEPVAGRLTLLNGHLVRAELAPELADQGVVFTDLVSAVRQHPDLVRQHLMTACVAASEGKFTALHGAFWDNGAFVHVPRGVEIGHPFEVIVGLDGEGSSIFPHTLIVAESRAAVTVIEQSLSLNGAKRGFVSGVTEIVAAEDTQVTYAEVQCWGEGVFSLNTRRAVQGPNSHVAWEMGQLGGRLSKTFLDSILTGDGASARFNGVYLVRDRQHVDLDVLMHHIGRGTSGDLLIKGAALDRARAVFRGMVRIEQSAQKTDSYLKSDNLILSDRARIDSIPGLVIDANDVRASHGATVGRVDDEHVFYLQSRGIPRATAVRLVVEGFFASVFDRMSQDRVRRTLAGAVAANLGDLMWPDPEDQRKIPNDK